MTPSRPARRTAAAAAVLAAVVVTAALVAGGAWAEGVLAAAAAFAPGALIALGARRGGRLPTAARWTALALSLVLAAAFAVLFALRGTASWIAGWPASLVVLLGGVWLLPLAFVGLAYALGFAQHGVTAADLERLRRLRTGTEGR